MAYKTSTYRAPTYTKSFTKSYTKTYTNTWSAKKPVIQQKTMTTVLPRQTTVINKTTVVHQPVITHDWGWHSPTYSVPVVVPIVATQPIIDVSEPVPQPVYYSSGINSGAVALILFGVLVAAACIYAIRRGYART